MQTIVIGAGVSGLACAHFLGKSGASVLLLEASDRAGGLISSVARGDFVLEEGPQSFLSTDTLLELVRDVRLDSDLLRADSRAPRFILVHGRLVRVPLAPPALLASPLLSARTKWTLLREAFARSTPPEPDESIAQFVRRKFTPQLLDRLVGPFVSGIYAGDPERLSMRSTFPSTYQWEKQFGSVIRGAMKSRPPKPAVPHTLVSFRRGNASFVRALADSLGGSLRCGVRVESISRTRSNGAACFSVAISRGGVHETLTAPSLVVATPADVAGRLLGNLSAEFDRHLSSVEYAPVAVVAAICRARQVGHPLDGFGFLVPRSEGLHLLGTVWNSSLFPGRAPDGYAVLTSFAGGATDRDLFRFDDQKIGDTIYAELARVLSIEDEPDLLALKSYPRALPQYNLGHTPRVEAARNLCADFPGLLLAGNYLEGPAVGACVDLARRVAASTQQYLRSTGA